MPKVKMTKSTPGSEDGFTTNLYLVDQEYDLSENLAKAFVEQMKVASYMRTRNKLVVEPSEPVVEVAPSEIKDIPEPVVIEEEAEVDEPEEEKEEKVEPKNTRVFMLAKELDTNWKEIIKVAQKLDIKVSVAQAGLTDSEVKKIKDEF